MLLLLFSRVAIFLKSIILWTIDVYTITLLNCKSLLKNCRIFYTEHTAIQAPALRFLLKCQRRIILVKVTLILKIKTPEGSLERIKIWTSLVIPQKKFCFFQKLHIIHVTCCAWSLYSVNWTGNILELVLAEEEDYISQRYMTLDCLNNPREL